LNGNNLNEKTSCDGSGEVLTLSTPRTDVPVITPNPRTFTGCGAKPVSELHRHLLLAAKHLALKTAVKW